MSNALATTDLVMFVAADGITSGRVGAEAEYGKIGDFFTRKKEDLAAEWDTIMDQIQDLLQRVSVKVQAFELQEIAFELGFSAEGHLGFIAKAGANGSVHVTFKRPQVDVTATRTGVAPSSSR
jgi:hypothetical protein